jgi:UDP-glucose 4-epimerase
MMKVLIIGSRGFIGSHALAFFKNKGFETWGCGVSDLGDEPNYFQVERFYPDYNNIFKLKNFDLCINASGAPGVSFSLEHPYDDFRMNVSNAYALLNAIRVFNPTCKFINLSSAAVYGNPQNLPIKESDQLNPLSPYGYHKMMAEQLVVQFNKIFQLRTCSFRIFSAYGPGLKKQLFWDIYQKALKTSNNIIQLFGTGEETRDFVYIDDVIRAIFTIWQENKFDGDVFNLASGTQTTIRKAAQILLDELNPAIELTFNNQQKPGDPLYWRADISNLNQINFTTVTSLKQGINLYSKWLQQEKS